MSKNRAAPGHGDGPVSVPERRREVMRAVVAIEATPIMRATSAPVRAVHVQTFNVIPDAYTDASLSTIGGDLRWLERKGYLLRPRDRHAEFLSTEAGRRWLTESVEQLRRYVHPERGGSGVMSRPLAIGDRVVIGGDHPHRTATGTIARPADLPAGHLLASAFDWVIALDSAYEGECFASNHDLRRA